VWGAADACHYTWREFAGDVELVARVLSVEYVGEWTKAGIMVREGVAAGAKNIYLAQTTLNGVTFQVRRQTDSDTVKTVRSGVAAPQWLKVTRQGNVWSGYCSGDGVNWTLVGTDVVALPEQVTVGLAVCSLSAGQLTTGVFDQWSALSGAAAQLLPAPWVSADVGAVTVGGSAGYAAGSYQLQGSGSGVVGQQDSFQYVFRPLLGNGKITARVESLGAGAAGLVIRDGLQGNARQAFIGQTGSTQMSFRYRQSSGGAMSATSVSGSATWLQLERQGSTVVGRHSVNGSGWQELGRGTVDLPENLYVGLGVAGGQAEFTEVTVSGLTDTGLPAPWLNNDIGNVGTCGSTTYQDGVFTLSASGTDISNLSDAFHYAYQPFNGEGWILARVKSLGGGIGDGWAKAGVMIRGGMASNADEVMLRIVSGNTVRLQYRAQAGGETQGGATLNLSVPRWLMLEKYGRWVHGYESADGTAWNYVGSVQMKDGGEWYAGLAGASHHHTMLNTAQFELVQVSQDGSPRGLLGEYFADEYLGACVASRIDRQVAFDWQGQPPVEGVGAQQYTVRWSGQVQARYTEAYTFYTTADAGSRLWIDGQLLIDEWNNQGNGERSGSVSLQSGQRHDLVLEYHQGSGTGQVTMRWSSAHQAKEIIPQANLYPAELEDSAPADNDGNGIADEWEETYFGQTGINANADADGDGLSNLDEYQQGSDPNDYYSQGSTTILPQLTIVSGNNQTGVPNQFLPQPLTVKVTDSVTNQPLTNAPVTFSVTQGNGKLTLQPSLAVQQHDTLTVPTNANGSAAINYLQPATETTTSQVSVSSGSVLIVNFNMNTTALTVTDWIRHWPFEESSGSIAQESSGDSALDAQLGGGTSLGSVGVDGHNALHLTQSSGAHISNSVNQILPGTGQPFSVSFWFKLDELNDAVLYNSLLCNESYLASGFRLAVHYGTNGPVVKFWSVESGGSLELFGVTQIAAQTWYHVTVSYAGGTAAMYLNGGLEASGSGQIVGNTNNLTIGNGIGGYVGMAGIIDELKIYSAALTLAEAQDEYNADSDDNGLPDWWEMKYFDQLGVGVTADADGDGLTNLQEYQQGSAPNDYYSQGSSTIIPQLTIVSGNNQTGASNQFLTQPLIVRVTDSVTHLPLSNAPVTFSVTQGNGKLTLQPSLVVQQHDTLTMPTNANGSAAINYLQPATETTTSQVTASSGGATSVVFTMLTNALTVPTAVINLTAQEQEDGSVVLSWENTATNATSIIITRSNGGNATWQQIATLPPTATNYTDNTFKISTESVATMVGTFILAPISGGAGMDYGVTTANPQGSSATQTATATPAGQEEDPPPSFAVIDLGEDYHGYFLNDNMQAVLRSYDYYLYDSGTKTPIEIPTHWPMELVAFNNQGIVLGHDSRQEKLAIPYPDDNGQANSCTFIWSKATGLKQWQFVEFAPFMWDGNFRNTLLTVYDINSNGVIVGKGFEFITNANYGHANLYGITSGFTMNLNGQTTRIGDSIIMLSYSLESEADGPDQTAIYPFAINNNGVMLTKQETWPTDTGEYKAIYPNYRPEVYLLPAGDGPQPREIEYHVGVNGNTQKLDGVPKYLNNTGLIVGWDEDIMPTLWESGTNGTYTAKVMKNGIVGPINNKGQVIGGEMTYTEWLWLLSSIEWWNFIGGDHLWQKDKCYAFSQLIPEERGWKNIDAKDLNNHGVILANATKTKDDQGEPIPEGQQKGHAVLLVPVELKDIRDSTNAMDDRLIQLLASGTDTNPNGIAWIEPHSQTTDQSPNVYDAGDDPRMPQLEIKLTGMEQLDFQVYWKMEVIYDRPSTTQILDEDKINIPTADDFYNMDGYIVKPSYEPWKIHEHMQGLPFFGGLAKISFRIEKPDGGGVIAPEQTVMFRIGGKNPDPSRCKSYIDVKAGDADSRLVNLSYAVAKHESQNYNGSNSHYNQFWAGNGTRFNVNHVRGEPLWCKGTNEQSAGGFGMFQITGNLSSKFADIPRSQLWNWQKNTDAYIVMVKTGGNASKGSTMERFFAAVARTYPNDATAQTPPIAYAYAQDNYSAWEMGTVTLYNGAGGCPVSYYKNSSGKTTEFTNPWFYDPTKPDSEKWQYNKNKNDYLHQVIQQK
jgi:hypothetical protein